MIEIKIYGERNTGTNYLDKLIRLNFDARILRGSADQIINIPLISYLLNSECYKNVFFKLTFNKNLGWKHSDINNNRLLKSINENNNLRIIIIVKNPYSFLLSLHNNPYHNWKLKNLTFEKFIEAPWKPVGRENLGNIILNSVQLWNIKTYGYLKVKSLFPNIVTIIKYEELIANPFEVIKTISNKLNINCKQPLQNYFDSTKSPTRDYDYYYKYYINEEWRNQLDTKSINTINKYLDINLIENLNYKFITKL